MAFSDLFQNLEDICKSDITQGANETTSTHEETLFGDVTEPYLTHLKHGEERGHHSISSVNFSIKNANIQTSTRWDLQITDTSLEQ